MAAEDAPPRTEASEEERDEAEAQSSEEELEEGEDAPARLPGLRRLTAAEIPRRPRLSVIAAERRLKGSLSARQRWHDAYGKVMVQISAARRMGWKREVAMTVYRGKANELSPLVQASREARLKARASQPQLLSALLGEERNVNPITGLDMLPVNPSTRALSFFDEDGGVRQTPAGLAHSPLAQRQPSRPQQSHQPPQLPLQQQAQTHAQLQQQQQAQQQGAAAQAQQQAAGKPVRPPGKKGEGEEPSVGFRFGRMVDAGLRDKCAAILQKPPESRGLREIGYLQELVKEVDFFKSLVPAVRDELCRVMSMQSFAPGEHVFNKGDEGLHFYVILRGSVSVHITADLSTAVNYVEEGQSFGELALINDEKRTATIVSRENSVLLLVSRNDYRQILQRQQVRMTNDKVACFAELPHFSTDEPYKLTGLVMSSKLVKVPANFVICKQGEMVSFLYIVQKGACRIIKEVRCAEPPVVRPGDSVTADRTFGRQSCFVEAEQLGRFGFFGENGLLVNRSGAPRASFKGAQRYPASMVSTVASEIVAVRITDFLRFTDRANLDGIVQFAKSRSERLEDKVLGQQLLNQIKWEQDKTALLDSMALALPRYKRCSEQRKAEQRLLRKPVPPTQRASGAKPAAEPAKHSPRARRSSLDAVFFEGNLL